MTVEFGGVTVERIVELEGPFLSAQYLLPTLSLELLEENRGWMEAANALGAHDFLSLCVQSFIVRTPHHTILVDSCIGNDKDRPKYPHWDKKTDTRFMDGLAAAGLSVEDIDYVMCTHLHTDHVGWNTKLLDGRWVPTFPNARYVFAKAEYEYWEAQNAAAAIPTFGDSVLPIVEAGRAELVASDHAVGDHVRLLATPGHTPGHVAMLLGKTGTEGVVSGDLIHSPLQARYPEMSILFDVDQAAAAVTRRAFLERFCDTGAVCCFTHFPSPSIGRVTRWGEGFRCDPV